MEGSDSKEFPGFQILPPKGGEFVKIRTLSRLQRQAPRPLQLKPPSASSVECKGAVKSTAYSSAADSASQSTFASCYHSKDPIPLLSPLVLPSLLEPRYVQGENSVKSHSFP